MVAIINPSQSVHRSFNYNENKVKAGVARCLGGANYPLDPAELSCRARLNFLLERVALNKRTKFNSVHISLNFHPKETGFSDQKLLAIAGEYMKQLGFADQPYLVYQHNDAGHPHIHIVTVNIRPNGKAISLHNIGREKSEPARKLIEQKYGLKQAEKEIKSQLFELDPIDISRVQYGRTESKKAIQTVLDYVLKAYKFTSLFELNAVLGLFNVKADRGGENSRTYRHRGLVYKITDRNDPDKIVGVPIKASAFYNEPTLDKLEATFEKKKASRRPLTARLRNAIELVLKSGARSVDQMVQKLKKQGVDVVLRKSSEGRLYGITYVDHRNKTVFNGSTLGKKYAAKGIQEQLSKEASPTPNDLSRHRQFQQHAQPLLEWSLGSDVTLGTIFSELIKYEKMDDFMPKELAINNRPEMKKQDMTRKKRRKKQ